MKTDIIHIIFGLKVRQFRLEAGMTSAAFANRCDLSPSYVTEIEKGRKYPKPEKILKMAEVLGRSYDELVSIKLDPSLQFLESALASPLLGRFPFEEFGLDVSDLVELLARAPDRASALLHALLEVGRQYAFQEEHFLRAALRSYQELHENYFQELEDAAAEFARHYSLEAIPVRYTTLEQLIRQKFGYQLDDTRLVKDLALSAYRSVFVNGSKPRLFINAALYPHQVKFLLAREMGYQYLGLKERSNTSSPDHVNSFQQVFNDFKASYFAGALLMPQARMLADLQTFFQFPTWNPWLLLEMLPRYDVTPEMLLYRFSELIPQFFGLRLHFLRVHDVNGEYRLVKQLNMSRVLLPSGLAVDEHFCRRWLAVRLLRELAAGAGLDGPAVGAQISEFLESHERFLCFGFARPLVLSPNVASSVITGFRLDSNLKNVMQFADDPAIPRVMINETCERCPLTADQCPLRGAQPRVLAAHKRRMERRTALDQLVAQFGRQ